MLLEKSRWWYTLKDNRSTCDRINLLDNKRYKIISKDIV